MIRVSRGPGRSIATSQPKKRVPGPVEPTSGQVMSLAIEWFSSFRRNQPGLESRKPITHNLSASGGNVSISVGSCPPPHEA